METEGSRNRSPLRRWVAFWATATILVALTASAAARFADPGSRAARKPAITKDHISFGDARKRQMAGYSKRHYGDREWRLDDPKVIVLHFTATDSYSSVWSTFDSNAPNLGEKPGVCSHYVVQQNGTIDELVSPRIRCRHTIGLNHVAIGIEMVQATGRGSHWADQQILERRRQIGAALKLVRWLQARYAIPRAQVIGHSMANGDRYFLDRQGWTNDHTDWLKRDVKEFRKRL